MPGFTIQVFTTSPTRVCAVALPVGFKFVNACQLILAPERNAERIDGFDGETGPIGHDRERFFPLDGHLSSDALLVRAAAENDGIGARFKL